ncbi:MAG TPA: hypothetical protein H9887_01210 [Candidatus Dorea intestinavium]|nr:hypothetical protein [Candidatus Dorea intestinavium]
MKTTSAYANKMIKQLLEEKEYWLEQERNSSIYTVSVGETPVVPEYDYQTISQTIAEIDNKIITIKHAINLSNTTSVIDIEGENLTIDTVLVKMAQKNNRKRILDFMRKQLPKKRITDGFYARNAAPEYQYINYDLEKVKADYEKIDLEIMQLQIALDKHNQTHEFEIEFH